jgi:hypothetical protein
VLRRWYIFTFYSYLLNDPKCTSVLVGHHLLLSRDFGPYVIIFMNVCVITDAMVWWSFAVKVFWALWDNIITVAMAVLLKEAYYEGWWKISVTEFIVGKRKHLQVTRSYLLQSTTLRIVCSDSRDSSTFQCMSGRLVWEWPATAVTVLYILGQRKKSQGAKFG